MCILLSKNRIPLIIARRRADPILGTFANKRVKNAPPNRPAIPGQSSQRTGVIPTGSITTIAMAIYNAEKIPMFTKSLTLSLLFSIILFILSLCFIISKRTLSAVFLQTYGKCHPVEAMFHVSPVGQHARYPER